MESGTESQTPATAGAEDKPRLRRPDRRQVLLEPVCLEERLPPEHPARAIWAVVEKLDLSRFEAPILARGEQPGRAATDPRLLVALWLLAHTDNVGSARALDRLCQEHDAYRWLCGGVSLNYHTLSDFRVGHGEALNALFTDDGTRVRASASTGSLRRRARLEELRAQAAAHVAALQKQVEDAPAETARQRAARQRAAREREQRVSAALAAMTELEQIKADTAKNHASKKSPPRASTTDPQARRMRLPAGSWRKIPRAARSWRWRW